MYTNLDNSPTKVTSGYLPMGPRAMWAVSALAGAENGDAVSSAALSTLVAAMKNDAQWGTTNQYFDESLALLGGLTVLGAYPNFWTLLKPTFPDTTATLTSKLKVTSSSVKPSTSTVQYFDTLKATFSHAVVCTLHVTGRPSGATLTDVTTSASQSLVYSWSTLTRDGGSKIFKAGDTVDVRIALPGWTNVPDSAKVTFYVAGTLPTGIHNVVQDRAFVRQMSNGAIAVHQPWFSGDVRVRLRNAAGVALYQGVQSANDRQISLPTLNLAPGWYAVETESAGQTAAQHFTLTR